MYKFAQRLHIQSGKLQVQQAERYLDNGEHDAPERKYDNAADLHIYGAHAHTAAAAHHRGDHEAAEELSSKAQDYSMAAA